MGGGQLGPEGNEAARRPAGALRQPGDPIPLGGVSHLTRASPDASLDVRSEQIGLLRQHPSLILFNLVNALLVVVVLWRIFPHELLVGWYTLFAIIIPARLILARVSRQRGWSITTFARLAVAGSAATGLTWLALPGRS